MKKTLKKYVKRILAVVVILLLAFSPYLLLVDFEKFSPIVVMIWVLSVVYYIFVRKKEQP